MDIRDLSVQKRLRKPTILLVARDAVEVKERKDIAELQVVEVIRLEHRGLAECALNLLHHSDELNHFFRLELRHKPDALASAKDDVTPKCVLLP
jgi:hypothetical protein